MGRFIKKKVKSHCIKAKQEKLPPFTRKAFINQQSVEIIQ